MHLLRLCQSLYFPHQKESDALLEDLEAHQLVNKQHGAVCHRGSLHLGNCHFITRYKSKHDNFYLFR